jgi:hypothetical protein
MPFSRTRPSYLDALAGLPSIARTPAGVLSPAGDVPEGGHSCGEVGGCFSRFRRGVQGQGDGRALCRGAVKAMAPCYPQVWKRLWITKKNSCLSTGRRPGLPVDSTFALRYPMGGTQNVDKRPGNQEDIHRGGAVRAVVVWKTLRPAPRCMTQSLCDIVGKDGPSPRLCGAVTD